MRPTSPETRSEAAVQKHVARKRAVARIAGSAICLDAMARTDWRLAHGDPGVEIAERIIEHSAVVLGATLFGLGSSWPMIVGAEGKTTLCSPTRGAATP